MDVHKARYLIALAEHGSFSRAAEAVGLTQPAFSRSIQALEHELGVRLVDRRGRRLQLTPAGALTVERGRRILKEISEAHRALERLLQGETGRVRLGAAHMPSARLLARFLREMAACRPEVHVTVELRSTTELVELLRTERIDVLVGDARSVPPSDEILVERVQTWRAAFMVRAGHPILSGGEITLERLAHWPIATPHVSPEGVRAALDLLGLGAVPPNAVTLSANDLNLLVDVACGSDTVIVTNPDGLADHVAARSLVELDVPRASGLGGTTVLARLAWRTLPSAVDELYRIARETADT